MECERCQYLCESQLPYIKASKKLNIIPYFLRSLNLKIKLMLSKPVNIWNKILAEKNFNENFKLDVAKHIYEIDKFPDVNFYNCRKCHKNIERMMFKYVRHQIIAKIFDFYATNSHLLIDEEKKIIDKYLVKYSNKIICNDWMGSYYYYYKIFKIPYPLRNIMSPEEYQERKKLYLSDRIYYHPLASNGFAQECWEVFEHYQ